MRDVTTERTGSATNSRTCAARASRFLFLSLLMVGVLGSQSAESSDHDGEDRPSILFIMSDDHAAHATGIYGGRLAELNPTPTLDQLAKQGMRFDRVFVENSICVPSRATIMTGQYSHNHGWRTNHHDGLPPDRQTLARLMKNAGYETAMIGKWHLKATPDYDHYAVLPGQGRYHNPTLRVKGRGRQRFTGHSSDIITNLSLDWLKTRDRDKPFFLMHHFKAPHDWFQHAKRYGDLYADIDIAEPKSLWRREGHGPPGMDQFGASIGRRSPHRDVGQGLNVDPHLCAEAYQRAAYQQYLKRYLRCVKGIDDNVGRLLTYLQESGELNDTVVIYTSDQGMLLGEHDYWDKRWMYEESLQAPFLVRYPRWIEAGSTNDRLVSNVDFAPTLLDIAGAEVPDTMDGRTLKPLIKGGEPPDDWRDAVYYRYWEHMNALYVPAHYGIRTERYKLIFFYGLPLDARGARNEPTPPYWELYDLEHDPREQHNVYHEPEYRDVVKRLTRRLIQKKKQVGDTDERHPKLQERFNRTAVVDVKQSTSRLGSAGDRVVDGGEYGSPATRGLTATIPAGASGGLERNFDLR